VTRADADRQSQFAQHESWRIAVTGATGFVGSALVPYLTAAGHRVMRVTRGAVAAGSGDVHWDPARGTLDARALDGVDAVIHLAGESIAERWTAERRRRILESRVEGTALMARTLATLVHPPRVLVSASAVGFYGNTGPTEVDEGASAGTGFLASVVQEWEEAADPARAAGIRVVHPRLGVVLSPGGGALARMLLPFKLGAGGPLAGGRQWMSWIAREDLLGVLEFLLLTDSLRGPVNAVAPNPVTNAEFTRTLASVLGRPAVTPVPAFALRLLFGEMADETLLAGQRVRPAALLAAGFPFRHPQLEEALRFEMGRKQVDAA